MSVLFVDFETRSACDLRVSGADVYARHESTDILCMAYAFGEAPTNLIVMGQPLPKEVSDFILSGQKIVAHNASFEYLIWNHVCVPKYGWPELKIEQLYCTMVACYAMGLPGSLEKAAAAVGIENGKDMAGNRIMRQLCQPKKIHPDGRVEWWDPVEYLPKFHAVYEYCVKDIDVQKEVYKRVPPLSAFENKSYWLDQKINRLGVYTDVPMARIALRLVELERDQMNDKIREITGGAVATTAAIGQYISWLNSRGIVTESVAKADVTELLSNPDLPSDVREALELRQLAAKSSTAKIAAMINGADTDQRMRGLFQFSAAGTRRWAGRRVQLQNLPRGKLAPEEIEEVFDILGRVT